MERKDEMDTLFDALYEIDPEGPDDNPANGKRILVKEILATLKEAVQADKMHMMPPLGGPEAIGIWLKQKFKERRRRRAS